jgi:hypothetical protein
MAQDYIPGSDSEFDLWQANFMTYANAHLGDLGLIPADMVPITAAQTAWHTALLAHIAAVDAAHGTRATKDNTRGELEAQLRSLIADLQRSPSVDDTERGALGIPIRDTQKTPPPAPSTRPVVRVDSGQRLRHVLHWTDEGSPTRRAKPAGVQGAEIWVKVGAAPPTGPSELTFLALDTSTPYTVEFLEADAGQTAHYMLRWVNTRGERGPWSETASATIGA